MNHPKNRPILPYLALAVGVLALSLSAMFVRWANAPGPITALYRVSISTLILAPFFLRQNARKQTLTRHNAIFPILGGIFTGFDFALWNTSLSYTTAANATLLGNTAPLWVALVSFALFKDRFSRNFWIGLAFTLGGATLVMGTDLLLHPQLGLGDMMAIGTGMFYAGYFIATQYGRRTLDVLSHLWLVGLSASFTLVAINLILSNPFTGYPPQTYLIFVASALVSQIIGYLSITYALGHLPATVVSPTMIGQPILTAILAIPLLNEIPTLIQAFGGLAALIGIYLVNQSHNNRASQQPSADSDAHAV